MKEKTGGNKMVLFLHDDPYGIVRAGKGKNIKLVLVPQKEWLPFLSYEVDISPPVGVTEIRLSLLEKNPFNKKEKNFFCEKDRLGMVESGRIGYKQLAEAALPFVTIQMLYGDKPFVKFVREKGELKIATNAFGYNDALHPDSIKYSQVASIVSNYFESSHFGKGATGPALAANVRETAEMIGFHSIIRQYGASEPAIEASEQA